MSNHTCMQAAQNARVTACVSQRQISECLSLLIDSQERLRKAAESLIASVSPVLRQEPTAKCQDPAAIQQQPFVPLAEELRNRLVAINEVTVLLEDANRRVEV